MQWIRQVCHHPLSKLLFLPFLHSLSFNCLQQPMVEAKV
ncbi:hypothetical protein pah_c180o002 [Parachlamydia acanthamoebae str. Hall's coccus]|nr:hypothetical protein pah_c180o002 [Parachlamydia acanthamoebae str. Hall's coccus]